MLVGANEGLMLRTNLVETKANMALAKLAGFRAVNLHAFWWPDVTEPREYDQQTLGNVAAASRLLGIPVFVAVTNTRGRYTPQDDEQREQFAKFAANVAEGLPVLHQDHRRQRAEPEQLLAAAVRRERRRSRRASTTRRRWR